MKWFTIAALVALSISAIARAQAFVHWETPHVHPADITPDGTKLLVVNTADNRLEVFNITSGSPIAAGNIPVGLDPVSVRARTNTEAWVVNHVSDTVSIVNLTSMNVVQTIWTDDEPCDVIFAGTPQRAFVSVSQRNELRVYDPLNPLAVPVVLNIEGEDPRALATDGTRVYLAIFEAGNRTTILHESQVNAPANPYPGDQNPPPNSGTNFVPPKRPGNPVPPRVGLIVKKQPDSTWRDDNNGNWTSSVTWDLHDHDVAIIDANTLAVSYKTDLMTINMALAVRPDGQVTVVGTDAINHIRFEPNLRGKFIRANMARFDPVAPTAPAITDLNPHLDYSSHSVPQNIRELSIGDPRAIIWNSTSTTAFVAGMGSNNVAVFNNAGARTALIEVGEGPTGLALDESRNRLYVINKFEGSISVINTATLLELARIPYHDPTPQAVKLGRPLLYDTHRTSGLGQASCAACHLDARMDQLSWDLGDPAGEVKPLNQTCNFGFGGCEDWHPMKGPMATQTLVGIVGLEPLHWRGDKEDLAAFSTAFVGLQGLEAEPTPAEMQLFEDFIATISFPPNPNTNLDGSLPTMLNTGGDPVSGRNLFLNAPLDGFVATCEGCHNLPTGSDKLLISKNQIVEPQSMKTPHLRNMYDKTGFDKSSMNSNKGFGFTNDGTIGSLFEFMFFAGFTFPVGPTGFEQRLDIEAYLLCFPTGTHSAVGAQVTIIDGANIPAGDQLKLNTLISLANTNKIGLIVKGRKDGLVRGWRYNGASLFQSDRAGETITAANLLAGAAPGSELTYTAVPLGSQTRIGIDRDSDTFFDRDELDAGSNPANPNSVPGANCPGDTDGNGAVNVNDISYVVFRLGNSGAPGSVDGDADANGSVNVNDISFVVFRLGSGCP